jgi:hypothetical protein
MGELLAQEVRYALGPPPQFREVLQRDRLFWRFTHKFQN